MSRWDLSVHLGSQAKPARHWWRPAYDHGIITIADGFQDGEDDTRWWRSHSQWYLTVWWFGLFWSVERNFAFQAERQP